MKWFGGAADVPTGVRLNAGRCCAIVERPGCDALWSRAFSSSQSLNPFARSAAKVSFRARKRKNARARGRRQSLEQDREASKVLVAMALRTGFRVLPPSSYHVVPMYALSRCGSTAWMRSSTGSVPASGIDSWRSNPCTTAQNGQWPQFKGFRARGAHSPPDGPNVPCTGGRWRRLF